MLNPQQLGILAQLVHDALAKFPVKPLTDAQLNALAKPGTPIPVEPWEEYLISEIEKIPELPTYDDMYDETDWLVNYFSSQIEMGS